MTNTTNTTTATAFMDTIKAYNENPKDPKALQNLATACFYAVTKKVYAVSAQRVIRELRQTATADLYMLDRLAYAIENATALEYNDDGDLIRVIKDRDLYNFSNKAIGENLGDGLDLIHDAIISILEQTKAQKERDPELPTDLERPFIVRRLKRKVYIKTADAVGAWETVTTTPIQEIYKSIRRSIESSRAVQVANEKYTYLDEYTTDDESGTTDRIYRRLTKYADLGGDPTDRLDDNADRIYGAPTEKTPTAPYTADRETVEQTDRLIERLNLTARELSVLKYRQSGYGLKAIATALGITENACKGAIHRIRDKATALGFTPKTPNTENE